MDGDTNQHMDDGIRPHNPPMKNGNGDTDSCNSEAEEKDVCNRDDGMGERRQDEDCCDSSLELNQTLTCSQKKPTNRLETMQPEDSDTKVNNQQKVIKGDKGVVSGQSDVEQEDYDTSAGKCTKDKNINNEVTPAGDGLRLRRSSKEKIIEHFGEGDIRSHVKTKRSPVAADNSRFYILLLLLLLLLSLLLVGSWFLRPKSPPLQKESNLLKVFLQEMEKVQAGFPSQHHELWRRSRIHLQKHLNLTNPTEPASLILTGGRGAEKTLSCLAEQLAAAFSKALNSTVLGIDGTTKSAQDSDQVKLDIDKALKEAFESGTQAAVIHHFEALPPGATLIFYRYCDHENAAFKKVFLAFTVMLQEEMDFPPNISLGMVEEVVQEYLKERFVSSDRMTKFNQMDLDKLSGLWSRISHLILPVASEQKIEQQGCQT